MDIVSRLKHFIDTHGIPITQFADKCLIPRPTLSQLLNGRNKKVSDEVIAKIHAAYPSLSVMWLMFGEGDMECHTDNISQSSVLPTEKSSHHTEASDNQDDDQLLRFDVTYIADSPENMAKRQAQYGAFPLPEENISDDNKTPAVGKMPKKSPSITFGPTKGKRVINIVVYYDDKSYESFVPDTTTRPPFS